MKSNERGREEQGPDKGEVRRTEGRSKKENNELDGVK